MSKENYKYNNSAYFFRESEAISFQMLLSLHKVNSEKRKITVDKRTYYVVQYNYPINKEE